MGRRKLSVNVFQTRNVRTGEDIKSGKLIVISKNSENVRRNLNWAINEDIMSNMRTTLDSIKLIKYLGKWLIDVNTVERHQNNWMSM